MHHSPARRLLVSVVVPMVVAGALVVVEVELGDAGLEEFEGGFDAPVGDVGVADVKAALEELKGQQIRVIDEHPRRGSRGASIAFIHPKSVGGVLVELVQE